MLENFPPVETREPATSKFAVTPIPPAPAGLLLRASCARVHKAAMLPFDPYSADLSDREREAARWHPERETLELAAAGAARVMGASHSATRAFAQAAITMAIVDLWKDRVAVKTLRRDQREAIAEAAEG